MLINVNFPSCPAPRSKGYAVTSQGKRDANLIRVEQRRDGRAIPYYWLMFQKPTYIPPDGSDLEALAAGKVSITPLKLDLTDQDERARYAAAFALKTEKPIRHALRADRRRKRRSGRSFCLRLRARGIGDLPLLRAMELTPRSLFLPQRFADIAARDIALPIGCGQTSTPPSTLALMIDALKVQEGARVLEVGAGSGYATALMSQMGAEIVTLERCQTLALEARSRLAAFG